MSEDRPTAVVTGASSGIGAATARALAAVAGDGHIATVTSIATHPFRTSEP